MADGIAYGNRPAPNSPTLFDEFQRLEVADGKWAEGRVYEIPCSAHEILQDPTAAVAHTEAAVEMAAEWGAGIIGLGSLTSVIGGHGKYIAENSPIPVTTGNSLTVHAALQNFYQACNELKIDIGSESVAIVGIPGSIATATARLLAPHVGDLILVARRSSARAERVVAEVEGDLVFDIPEALSRSRLIISATSAGNCIDQKMLQAGSIVIDVGVPADVCNSSNRRDDVLLISGGVVDVPKTFLRKSMLLGFHFGLVPGCLAETINLALEERGECFSLGRDLSTERVEEIGRIAALNGFSFDQLSSFGRPVPDSTWASMAKVIARQRAFRSAAVERGSAIAEATQHPSPTASLHAPNGNGPSNGRNEEPKTTVEKLGRQAKALFHRYVNPVLVSVADQSGLSKTFIGGDGMYLTDSEQNRYLDFVAGFGSMNLGHNHPRVVSAVTQALAEKAPGFAQTAVNPYAAALSERLVSISPPGLELVFFCNSGTEAVEAALKLARASTGRTGLVYCHGSFHGKSLGSLSVTGNRTYQQPFAPLLPDCHAVPFGDLEVLQRTLSGCNMAAFIVEPIQGEAGMIMPPPGYLAEAQRLCRQYGTLLIADEVQTGMGRTGTMFASQQAAIEPDIMTLAKSLSGGLVPIGAMLARRDLWLKAYGTVDRFALHTSTFGGGSLACAAGLATIEALVEDRLLDNVVRRGDQLMRGLNNLRQQLPNYFHQIRGQGLMVGVELTPLAKSVVTHLKRTDSSGMLQYLMPGVDEMIGSFPTVFQMQILLEHYHIYSQIARSNPLVLRIQPPLIVDDGKVDHFLSSFARTCQLGQKVEGLFDEVITRSISGQHAANQQTHSYGEIASSDEQSISSPTD
ncbi:MAG: aminotransferase class III-fold pyridoxal phosphate-dependent enzyme, partial [Planctomycetales bacterium]